MQKIKKYSWNVSGRVVRVQDSFYSSNDNNTAKIEIATDEIYNGYDSVLLVQKKGVQEAHLYNTKVNEGKSVFELDAIDVEKGAYELHFRLYNESLIAESPVFSYEVTEGAEFTEVELSQKTIAEVELLIQELLRTIDKSNTANEELLRTVENSKTELTKHKDTLEKQLTEKGNSEVVKVETAGTGEIKKVTAEGIKQTGIVAETGNMMADWRGMDGECFPGIRLGRWLDAEYLKK